MLFKTTLTSLTLILLTSAYNDAPDNSTPEKAAQAFALIKKRGFWESTESVKIPAGDSSTGAALFEIEAKDKTKQKIAFCDREFDRDYTSTYENLCKDMFVFVSEP